MRSQRKTAGVNIGGASILMVFSVLCLTIFAVLTLVSANAESNLANKSAASVKNYYEAEAEASQTLCEIYQIIDEHQDLQSIKAAVAKLPSTVNTSDDNGRLVISYSEKIDDNQELIAKLRTDGKLIKIISWKVQSTSDWVPSDDINVFQG